MELTVLGGSAAGPNPGQGCSGYLVHSGQTRVVLDLGPGTLPELRKHANFRTLDGIVVSHLHVDHWLDLLALRFALAYNPVPPPGPIPLWLPPGGFKLLNRLAGAVADSAQASAYFSVFDVREFDPAGELSIGDLCLRFQSTMHYVPCWAIRVSNGRDGDLFYTADTGPAADLADFALDSSVVVAEGTAQIDSKEDGATRGHLTPEEAALLARRANAEILVLSHLWAENDPFAALAACQEVFGASVELGVPGLTIRWSQTIERQIGGC